tara:strand:+ start:176 stop:574 length:399 start_codon:yes stop_codon:yes gene_type:complete
VSLIGVSSQRRKSRKAYFTAGSTQRRKLLSAALSKDLRAQYGCRSIPVRKGDSIKVVRGGNQDREGKVLCVYRRRWCIHVDKLTNDKKNGQAYQIPIHPSNCVVTAMKLDKDRKALLERKKRTAGDKVPEMD